MSPIPGHAEKWHQFFERYPDAIVSPWGGYLTSLTPEALDALLSCDVILTFETWYDPTIPELAESKGVGTVIMVNPELWRPHETEHASAVWVPTDWRLSEIPRAEVVTMPVALDRLPYQPGEGFLHLGGHKARNDRNGMEIAIRAARYAGIPLTVTSQDKVKLVTRGIGHGPTLDNYWEMYQGYGVLVFPRKYGGLSLAVQEALASGLAVIMSHTSPNQHWPVSLVPCLKAQKMMMPGGMIEIYETDRRALAEEMQRMTDLEYRREFQERGRAWAEANSWEKLGPEWLARLEAL